MANQKGLTRRAETEKRGCIPVAARGFSSRLRNPAVAELARVREFRLAARILANSATPRSYGYAPFQCLVLDIG